MSSRRSSSRCSIPKPVASTSSPPGIHHRCSSKKARRPIVAGAPAPADRLGTRVVHRRRTRSTPPSTAATGLVFYTDGLVERRGETSTKASGGSPAVSPVRPPAKSSATRRSEHASAAVPERRRVRHRGATPTVPVDGQEGRRPRRHRRHARRQQLPPHARLVARVRDHGERVPLVSIHRSIGMGSTEMLHSLIGRDDDAITDSWRKYFNELLPEIVPCPGAAELLRALHGRRLRRRPGDLVSRGSDR